MQFSQSRSDFLVPDGTDFPASVRRTTHLGIGAHADDLEFMALHGILECHQHPERWFGGVVCTDGAGSARAGRFADFTDEQMRQVRLEEQREAACIGQYGFVAQLGFSSAAVKAPSLRTVLVGDLERILREACPEIIYTHNPFDRHPTHVGVLLAVLEAVGRLPVELRPRKLVGCEVWRSLDWLPDHLKLVHPLDAHPGLAERLNAAFQSQIGGGKRYDLAVAGRRMANATFHAAHQTDAFQELAYALDLTGLIRTDLPDLDSWMRGLLDAFSGEVLRTLGALKG